ncbi:DUF2586 domain-containing protein [Xylanibacter muris]|uniref:DUF2586 family protein n=1 Tax=Xylanibacter muris TaxID=2736290 RepID=A0ABX2AN95_9BACT|nr:DUF2586 domain-containing protein [Xylanibacter muris]NPD91694.1 DUF2586 family protein [Xylanibacter muris]
MQLPRVKIQFLNGQLGTVGESPDGLMALICGASAVAGKLELNTVYRVTSPDDLTALGVTETNNATLYKQVKEFYDEAESGTKLILYPVSANMKVTELCDYTKTSEGFARDLITRQNGALRGIGVAGLNAGSTAASANGLDPDVFTALPKAQQLAEWATSELYAPLFFVLEGRNYDASKELKDLTEEKYNRVCVVIGDTVKDSKGACMGTLLGRIASIPVQRNIGRVKDGSLFPLEMYVGAKKIEESGNTISAIFENGYIVPRKHVGRSGYYFADAPMACDPTDDYAYMPSRRVIDKAYRISYDTMLEELLDELELNEDGTLQHAVVKSWQQTLENAINRQMTAGGELSATDGEGCKCHIDARQDVVSTSKIVVTLKVRPHGYSRYIDVNLGFLVTTV